MWLSAIKLAVSAGSKIYENKQKTKMAMSEAQLMHATKMAQGEEQYQGKLLEARQSDWKDEAVLIILSLPEYSNSPEAIFSACLACALAIIILVSCFFL